MATIATFRVPASDFALGDLTTDHPGTRIKLEAIVPVSNRVMPFLYVSSPNLSAFCDALRNQSTIKDFHPVHRDEDEAGICIHWDTSEAELIMALTESDVHLLSATAQDGECEFTIRAGSRDAISRFHDRCRSLDPPIDLDFVSISTDTASTDDGGEYGLTDLQRETLLTALRMGFFDQPRRATMDDLAAELGIARSSVSARLRRAHRQLIQHTLARDSR